MPKRCASFGCFGNYKGQSYVRMVKFPTDVNERERWIQALPNSRESLNQRKEIYICASHFNCSWIVARGGKRSVDPPSVFPQAPKSCMKQNQPRHRKQNLLEAMPELSMSHS